MGIVEHTLSVSTHVLNELLYATSSKHAAEATTAIVRGSLCPFGAFGFRFFWSSIVDSGDHDILSATEVFALE